MPYIITPSLPIPKLRIYISISCVLFSIALYHGINALHKFDNLDTSSEDSFISIDQLSYFHKLFDILNEEIWSTYILINTACCCWVILGLLLQLVVFGKLRDLEKQNLRDKFWNYVFYKFIFVFGVLNVQTMAEVMHWMAWFAVMAFIHLLSQLSKDRFEFISFSPSTRGVVHARIVALLSFLFLTSTTLLGIAIYIGAAVELSLGLLMSAECFILCVKILYIIVRYAIHLYDIYGNGKWESQSSLLYFTEFYFEMLALTVDLFYHLHMLVYSHIFISMASLVVFLNLRFIYHELQRRLIRHRNYKRVVALIELRFPLVQAGNLDEDSNICPICWEVMLSARRLSCGHCFHCSCLHSWMEQNVSCPTCRKSLTDNVDSSERSSEEHGSDELRSSTSARTPNPAPEVPSEPVNHYFHFDGPRYVSWFPRISVGMTRFDASHLGSNARHAENSIMHSSHLQMVHQVQQILPHIQQNAISADLLRTRSVEQTVENFLDGHIEAPLIDDSGGLDDLQSDITTNLGSFGTEDCTVPSVSPISSAIPTDVLEVEHRSSEGGHHQTSDLMDHTGKNLGHIVEESCRSMVHSGRFSKSPIERANILEVRKKQLYANAFRIYKRKCQKNTSAASEYRDTNI